ncbi:MAG TPA: FAD-dependent oxidoreductase [Candidatus Acidoferrales bacterium]|nr:FAD-dependent oxidoreductase [Candidatus Acidoferrales bacterium]
MKRRSRRQFLKTCATAGAASLLAPHVVRSAAAGPSVVVIGAGAFGGWTALELLRRGARVTLLDAWGPGHSRASSGGETRVIRCTYGAQKIYTRMALRALERWREAERKWNRKVFFPTGALWMVGQNDAYEKSALPVLKEAGVAFDQLTAAECSKRWPQINFEGVAWSLYEREAGYLLARQSCQWVVETFRAEGGTYRQAQAAPGKISAGRMADISLAGGERVAADQFVFACGPWLRTVLPGFEKWIRPTRQEVFFFGTPPGDARYTDEGLPVWIDNGAKLFYGIPGNQLRGFKLADDSRGAEVDPTTHERRVSDAGLASARAYMEMRFPGMRGAPLVESRVCQYENSPDENFLLDHLPDAANAWVLGGGSGHGFKHGPALGEMAADAVLGRAAAPKEFSLLRKA